MTIVLTIDRLVIDGLPATAADGARIGAAIESELTRLLTVDGLPKAAGGAVPDLPPSRIEWPREIGAADAGARIAQAVHGTIAGGSPVPASASRGGAA
jgi:hypothetical protein